MKINHAILHILDFDSAVNVMSQRELDIESRTVRVIRNHAPAARSYLGRQQTRHVCRELCVWW